jgi:hypothetical protein
MSYNFKDLILDTWKLIQPRENEAICDENSDELLIDENYNYMSSDDEDNIV